MTSRRDFLRRGSIALAGGLLLGDAALEAFDRLTHCKVWAGHTFEEKRQAYEVYLNKRLQVVARRMAEDLDSAYIYGFPSARLHDTLGYIVIQPPAGILSTAPLARLVRTS